jgi:hypothetical protein
MIEETNYHGWKALHLSTAKINLIIPIDIGPRVLHASFGEGGKPGENLFAERPEELGGTGESAWKIRGGHRLWIAPEHPQRTYEPDNRPVEVACCGEGAQETLQLSGAYEAGTGLRKRMELRVLNDSTVKVTHQLCNEGPWPVELAAWGLTVMKYGGYGVLPFNPLGSHPQDLLPRHTLIPWTYTDLSAPVWKFRTSHLGIDTVANKVPQKLGISHYPGWAAYWQEAGTFVKFNPVQPLKTYPDLGSAYETFACDWMLEMESLSPLETLQPGGVLTHVEYWGFLENLRKPETEALYTENFRPIVLHWLEHTPA